jgi:zinc protease
MRFVQRALNPADYLFVFTGNLDLAVIRSYVATYLASIPVGPSWDTFGDLPILRPGQLDRTLYKGKEAQSFVFLGWFKQEPYTESGDAAARVLAEYLNIKLIQEIREKLGGVYSIQAEVSQSNLPGIGELLLDSVFLCDPGRALELSGAVTGQLELVAQGSIDADAFGKAVEALRKSWEESMQSNYYIAQHYVSLAVRLDLPMGALYAMPDLYGAVTPADIQALCNKLLPQGQVRIILYPEG